MYKINEIKAWFVEIDNEIMKKNNVKLRSEYFIEFSFDNTQYNMENLSGNFKPRKCPHYGGYE